MYFVSTFATRHTQKDFGPGAVNIKRYKIRNLSQHHEVGPRRWGDEHESSDELRPPPTTSPHLLQNIDYTSPRTCIMHYSRCHNGQW